MFFRKRVCGKHLKKGRSLQKNNNWKVEGWTISLSHSKWANQILLLPVESVTWLQGQHSAHIASLLWAAVFNQILAKASQESRRVLSVALGSYFNQEILFVSDKNQSDCSGHYSQAYSSFLISPQLNPIGHWLGACTWELLIQLTWKVGSDNIQPAEGAGAYDGNNWRWSGTPTERVPDLHFYIIWDTFLWPATQSSTPTKMYISSVWPFSG